MGRLAPPPSVAGPGLLALDGGEEGGQHGALVHHLSGKVLRHDADQLVLGGIGPRLRQAVPAAVPSQRRNIQLVQVYAGQAAAARRRPPAGGAVVLWRRQRRQRLLRRRRRRGPRRRRRPRRSRPACLLALCEHTVSRGGILGCRSRTSSPALHTNCRSAGCRAGAPPPTTSSLPFPAQSAHRATTTKEAHPRRTPGSPPPRRKIPARRRRPHTSRAWKVPG